MKRVKLPPSVRRVLARLRPGRYTQRVYDLLPVRQQRMLSLVSNVLQIIIALTIAVLLLFAVAQGVLGAGFFVPRDGKGVLESVKDPTTYRARVEIIRQRDVRGQPFRQDVLRVFSFDDGKRRWAGSTRGYTAGEVEWIGRSNGDVFTRIDRGGLQQLRYPLRYEQVVPLSADDLVDDAPSIENDKGTYGGRRAWILRFKPTGAQLQRALWKDVIRLTGPDADALAAGRYTLDYARAWVIRDDRQLRMIDIQFRVGTTRYRILTVYNLIDKPVFSEEGTAVTDDGLPEEP